MEELLNINNIPVSRSCCSYCRSRMHNIRGCNSLDIEVLLNCLQQAFAIIRRTNTQTVTKDLYTHWLLHTYNLQQLKVVAVTRMDSRVSGLNKADYADKIWYIVNYMYENNDEEEVIEEVEWIIDRLPNPDEFQTPPTMSPRDAPPEIVRQSNSIILTDDDLDHELMINSFNSPRNSPRRNDASIIIQGFDYIQEMNHYNRVRGSGVLDLRIESEKLDINVKTQEFIGLAELLEDNFECSICYENQDKSMKLVLGCNHEFCTECIIKTLETNNKPRCAFCRDVMKDFTVYNKKELNKFKECCRVK